MTNFRWVQCKRKKRICNLMPNASHLEPLGFRSAPELIEMLRFVVNTVQNDEGEKAIVQGFLECFKHAVAVGVLHFWLILKF